MDEPEDEQEEDYDEGGEEKASVDVSRPVEEAAGQGARGHGGGGLWAAAASAVTSPVCLCFQCVPV